MNKDRGLTRTVGPLFLFAHAPQGIRATQFKELHGAEPTFNPALLTLSASTQAGPVAGLPAIRSADSHPLNNKMRPAPVELGRDRTALDG